ncbi:MBL fold metallo-hydrolase [Patescibacteria group bacterium]|nr:MAG: MBL fold metallo-hydrolase [Patescibacteria group bacterium]
MKSNQLKLTFCGGVGQVTGANFLLENDSVKILIDCGLLQGVATANAFNSASFVYNPADVHMLFVTHAHLDHVGRIAKLVRDGFRGVIYSTPNTKDLAKLIMEDALSIMKREMARDGREPMYDIADIEQAQRLWKTIPYHTATEIPGGLSVYFKDAGHILGSAIIEFSYGKKKIVFTGDLGNSPTPLLRDTEVITDADYLVMESVYGDRNHEPVGERKEKLERIINESASRGGTLVIPAFSIERTQVILYEINSLVEAGKVPSVPVFVDSPLAIKVTDIYKTATEHFKAEVQKEISDGDDIFNFPKLQFTINRESSEAIDRVPNPKIILAGAGMSNGGRITHHEMRYLPDPKSTILFVGYQSAGTLGREIQSGVKNITIQGSKIKVRATIDTIYGYSSHKDSDHLVEFVSTTKDRVQKVFVVMGETKSALFLVQRLRDYLGVNAVHPELNESVILDF